MSKYHKGDKFIVEIKEVMNSDNGTLYRSEFSTLTFDDYGLDKLQKYNEPNPIYIEQAKKCLETETYNKGLEDGRKEVWELALKISVMEYDERDEIFGSMVFADIIGMYTPQEALAKLEAYEKEQEEIKVGDVVRILCTNFEYLVTHIEVDNIGKKYYCGISKGGKGMVNGNVEKTNKHIDISSILEQIGGGE